MLVMVRWNVELPRLMPLVVESLRQEEEKATRATAVAADEAGRINNIQDISKQIVVVEDRPGLFFDPNSQSSVYPVLVMVKNSPFTSSELDLIKARAASNDAKVIAMPGAHTEPPYDKLLSYNSQQQSPISYNTQNALLGMKPPTDDSPFYFAKEPIPSQMVLLLETVLGVSAVLALLLMYYLRKNRRINSVTSLSSIFHITFVIFIGFGFIFLEITFIQKFLLLLGTPIMALTVILFSILLSSGIGAYLSGKLFSKNPYRAVTITIPFLAALILIYYHYLPILIGSSITLDLYQRIGITFALLSPVGLLMGFQFPSITKLASYTSVRVSLDRWLPSGEHSIDNDITLLWGVNVIASVIGTVLAAVSSMLIGFSGNLLIGIGLYIGALGSAIASVKAKDVIRYKKMIVK
jgi:hypothetical protein